MLPVSVSGPLVDGPCRPVAASTVAARATLVGSVWGTSGRLGRLARLARVWSLTERLDGAGVPRAGVFVRAEPVGSTRAIPKSVTRTRPSLPTSTLSGLKSRWISPAAWAAARPRPAAVKSASPSRHGRDAVFR
jgi:hypothetical protein